MNRPAVTIEHSSRLRDLAQRVAEALPPDVAEEVVLTGSVRFVGRSVSTRAGAATFTLTSVWSITSLVRFSSSSCTGWLPEAAAPVSTGRTIATLSPLARSLTGAVVAKKLLFRAI